MNPEATSVTPASPSAHASSPWPERLGRWTLMAAVPLVLFGGTVTTMRAGMAEDGWLTPDGHLLWLYPWALRIRNAGVFVEHHHRELGSLVGMLSIATVVATWVCDRRWSARLLAFGGLAAVSGQGAIGGFRVLENSPELAFLHGTLGQAVFTLLAVVAVALSRSWREAAPGRWTGAGGARPSLAAPATLTLAVVFGQATLGAWLRHGHAPLALVLHVAFAVVATGAVILAARRFQGAARDVSDAASASGGDVDEGGAALVARRLRRAARRLHVLLGTQVLLGVLATISIYSLSGGMKSKTIHPAELIFATAHVAVGALLLAALASAALWGARLAPRRASSRLEGRLTPEGVTA